MEATLKRSFSHPYVSLPAKKVSPVIIKKPLKMKFEACGDILKLAGQFAGSGPVELQAPRDTGQRRSITLKLVNEVMELDTISDRIQPF